jgi:alkylation response protein AidB-like acyl-CoA dehydrogenase
MNEVTMTAHLAETSARSEAKLNEARAFVNAQVVPSADVWDRAERVPSSVLAQIGELGLWAPFLPAGDGGDGLDMVTLGRLHEEIGRGCSSLRSLLTVHTMVAWTVHRWGTPAQQQRWLSALAAGTVRGAFCLSEPNAGADTENLETTAIISADGWVLNGRKKWITGGQSANLLLVFAAAASGMNAFLVPADTPGVGIRPLSGIAGTSASMLAEIFFHDVHLGPQALIGPAQWASATVMTGALDLGRYSVACGAVGIIKACMEACVTYTSHRRVHGSALSEFQLVRRKISDMVTSFRAGRALCAEAGRLKDANDPATIMATWVAKYYSSTAATSVAADAVQIHGANGFTADYPVARLYRDSKVTEIIEGSTELQQLTIADDAYRGVM